MLLKSNVDFLRPANLERKVQTKDLNLTTKYEVKKATKLPEVEHMYSIQFKNLVGMGYSKCFDFLRCHSKALRCSEMSL